jgi:hypothetical protein
MAPRLISFALTTCLFLSNSTGLQAQFKLSKPTAPLSITLTPSTVSLGPGQSQQFNVSVGGTTNTDVMWSISPMVGSVSNGRYTAPLVLGSPMTVTLTVTSMVDMITSASSTITLSPLGGGQQGSGAVTVTPAAVSLMASQSAQFSVQVNASNKAVTWSLTPAIGTINNGTYTAPPTISTAQTVVLTVTSVVDNTKKANVIIALMPKTNLLVPVVALALLPTSVSLRGGQSAQFTASVTGSSNTAVTWSVTPPVGTVSNGLYTAPATVLTAQTIAVTATSQADPTKTATSTVSLLTQGPTASGGPVSLTPTSVLLTAGQAQQFSFNGGGKGDVMWSLVPMVGSVLDGLYRAPIIIGGPMNVTLIATSMNDPSKTASAAIQLSTNAAAAVSLGVSPTAVSLGPGQTATFSANVSGTSNTAVSWSVVPAVGSIVNGVYTAPTIATGQPAVTVVATSMADPSKTASATVTLTTIGISVVPTSITLGSGASSQFTASVTGTSNTLVNWSVSPALGTVVNGLYTAPSGITSTQVVTLTAVSAVDSTKSASASITLTPTVPSSLVVNPAQTSLSASQSQQFSTTLSGFTLGGSGVQTAQWSVNPPIGSITSSGLYTAPGSISTQQNVIVTATNLSGTASATVTLTPSALTSTPTSTLQLPLEVMGTNGTTVSTSFNIPAGSNLNGQLRLWLQVHGLKYQTQGSVQVNGGNWIPINDTTVTLQGYAAAVGGIGGGFTNLKLTINLPAGAINQGSNTLTFRFNQTDGTSSGYRVLNLNVLASDGTQLIAPSSFSWDDPTTWQPPLNTPADIQAGQALWNSANLTTVGGPIQAKCGSCHAQDGADLKYFNYSNLSIRVRSMFHGLTAQQGDQIASYIRTLNVAASVKGRPWNPPYQPGPGTDSKPVYEWAAGAGLDAVLNRDVDVLAYTLPAINTGGWAWNGYLNAREIPIPLQLPDWNSWLPTVHPMDAFGTQFTGSTLYTEYLNLRTQAQVNDPVSYANVAPSIRLWLNRWEAAAFTPPQSDPRWLDAKFVSAMHSLGLWSMVKLWELNHEYGLEGMPKVAFGPQAESRAWYTSMPFFVSPFMQGIPRPSPGIGNGLRVTHVYQSFMWYQVQLVLNDGNGIGSSSWPIDWAYSLGYLTNDLTWDAVNAVPRMGLGGMLSLWLVKAMQISTDGVGNPAAMVNFPANPSTWSDMSSSQKLQVMNAFVAAWFARFSGMSAQEVVATGLAPLTFDVANPGWGPLGLVFSLPQLRFQGVDPTLLNRIATWASTIWPAYNWNADLNGTCWVYNLGQIFCGP